MNQESKQGQFGFHVQTLMSGFAWTDFHQKMPSFQCQHLRTDIYYTYESSGRCLLILISPLVWFLYHTDLKRKTPVKGLRCTRGHSFCFPTTTPNVVSSSALVALKALLTPPARSHLLRSHSDHGSLSFRLSEVFALQI